MKEDMREANGEAHYSQLQAMGDALSHAAQLLQSQELEREQTALASIERALSLNDGESAQTFESYARQHHDKAQYWYGVFMGVRGILRAVEHNTSELDAVERQMLERIVWDHDPPYFSIPGFEHVQGKDNARS